MGCLEVFGAALLVFWIFFKALVIPAADGY